MKGQGLLGKEAFIDLLLNSHSRIYACNTLLITGTTWNNSSLGICVTVVDDTKSAVELAVREAVGRQGLSLLAESPKPLKFQDERGSSLTGKRFKFKLIEAHTFS